MLYEYYRDKKTADIDYRLLEKDLERTRPSYLPYKFDKNSGKNPLYNISNAYA